MTVRKPPVKVTATGTRGFLEWLKANQPAVYNKVRPQLAKQAGGMLAGFGLTDPASTAAETPAPKSWTDSLKDIVLAASQAYLSREQIKSQSKILDVQLQRAQANLPPLDIDLQQYGIQAPQLQVGLTSDTMKKGALILAGLAGVWFLAKVFGGRRR